ncbi:MAG: lipoprotein [Proteobacteria bacterium]|jgi:predicted small lipoprotein YifL|nr:lipoprotein [Pseudomonadota bacterium]MDA0992147.1 lipoprotein [Pseudomonadota bacterium]
MRNSVNSVIVFVLFLAFLSACGQTGPLFLPGDPSTLQSIPSAEQLRRAAEAAEEEDGKEKQDPQINQQ